MSPYTDNAYMIMNSKKLKEVEMQNYYSILIK